MRYSFQPLTNQTFQSQKSYLPKSNWSLNVYKQEQGNNIQLELKQTKGKVINKAASMLLVTKIYFVQVEELKLLHQFPAFYNQYTDILTLLKRYVATFPLTYHVYSIEESCKCKSMAAQILMLKRDQTQFLIFKTDFILSIPRKCVKKKYLNKNGQTIKSDFS